MPVLIDSTQLRRKMQTIAFGLTESDGVIDNAVKASLDRTANKIADEFATNETAMDQVGFDVEQFRRNIAVQKLGPHFYGILDTDKMGGPEDIEAIFGQSGLWHMGTGNIGLFTQVILGSAGKRQHLASLRQGIWDPKTPQWIYIEYGATIMMEPMMLGEDFFGAAEQISFQVDVPPAHIISSNIQASNSSIRRDVRAAVQANVQRVARNREIRQMWENVQM